MPRLLMVLSLLAAMGLGASSWACDEDKNKDEKKDKSAQQSQTVQPTTQTVTAAPGTAK